MQRADMAICDFTITPERKKAVDFTAPFMSLGMIIEYRKHDSVSNIILMSAIYFQVLVFFTHRHQPELQAFSPFYNLTIRQYGFT